MRFVSASRDCGVMMHTERPYLEGGGTVDCNVHIAVIVAGNV